MSNLTLTVEGRLLDQLAVVSFRGTEQANGLYRIDIDLTTTNDTDDGLEDVFLQRPTTLSVYAGAGEITRSFQGIASSVTAHGMFLHERRAYRLVLVPRLWLLTLRATRRVWSAMSTLDIAAQLFKEHGVSTRTRVQRPPGKLDYRVQYDESDLAFLERILAEDGLFYTFDHPRIAGGDPLKTSMGAAEVVVISDTASSYAPIDGSPELTFARMNAAGGMSAREDHVTHFAPRSSIRSTGARIRGYDHRRPSFDLRDEAWIDRKAAKAQAMATAIPPAAGTRTVSAFEGSYEEALPAIVPDGLPRTVPGDATRRLEAERADARVVEGASFCPRMMPGRTVVVHSCELSSFDGRYVVVSVEHEGYSAEVAPAGRALYQNRFVCAPDSVPLRPAVAMRRPPAMPEVGRVVGPTGQDIYTDDLGRVRVRLPWDANAAVDDAGTCWMRVAQVWAGAAFGGQFVPRVGMEVVVTYLDGDPDRPLVTGCVYNAAQVPPFALPGSKTRSGLRTRSSPGGAGQNELSFDDEAGKEQVFVHAQRNLDEVVEKNHTLLVKSDEFIRVIGSRMDSIEKNLEAHVRGDSIRQIDGNSSEVVAGNANERVTGMRMTQVDGKDILKVKDAAAFDYADEVVVRVKGCMTTLVGKHDKKRSWMTHAEGVAKLSSMDSTIVSSEGELLLRVGKSSIRITEDQIEIQSPAITAKGAGGGLSALDDGLRLSSKGDVQVLVDKKFVVVTKGGASLSMDKQVKVDGEKILMNSPDQATDPPPKLPDPPTKVTFKDAGGKPLAYQRYLVTMADGTEVTGVTDKDGKAEADLKSGGKVTFPDVSQAS